MNTSLRSSSHSALLLVALAAPVAFAAACGDDGTDATTSSSSGGDGGAGGAGSTGLGPMAVSSSSTTGSGATTSGSGETSSSASTSSGEGGSGEGGAGGSDGGAGGGAPLACDAASFGAGATSTVADVWTADPAEPTSFFVADVVVTAVSQGACVDGAFCQLFVQQEETFASFDAGAHQAIRVLVAPEVAGDFTGIVVGDRVNLGGFASRDTADGRDELRFFIRESDPGCMTVEGAATPEPVPVELAQLTQDAYESTHGPILVVLDTVSGKPHLPDEIFALWDTGGQQGGGIESVTNASPFFLPGGVFDGLIAEQITDFASVTGVYGQYPRENQGGNLTKYETIYVRSMDDVVIAE
jgi:hypothetical protein